MTKNQMLWKQLSARKESERLKIRAAQMPVWAAAGVKVRTCYKGTESAKEAKVAIADYLARVPQKNYL